MAIDVSNKFPYKDFTDVNIENVGDFVRIPKIFVKAETDENGLITRYISNSKIESFHCHPAFMFNGHEKNFLLIGKYLTRGTVNNPTSTPLEEGETEPVFKYSDMQTAITNLQTAKNDLTFHTYNIYDHHLLALLMLIEFSTTNVYESVKNDYHGVKGFWGYETPGNGIWIDGLKKAKITNHIEILNNLGNPNIYVDTGIISGTDISNGFVVSVQDKIGDGYDLNDIFLSKYSEGVIEDSSYYSRQNFWLNNSSASSIEGGTATYPSGIYKAGIVTLFANLNVNAEAEKYPFRICKFSD